MSMITLDCRGLLCPTPILELARHIGDVAVGDVLEVSADDPAAAPDIAAWCRMRQHELVTQSTSAAGSVSQVRRLH